MLLRSDEERSSLRAISELAYLNPFLPERQEFETQALGEHMQAPSQIWSYSPEAIRDRDTFYFKLIKDKVKPLAETLRERLVAGCKPAEEELQMYDDLIGFLMYFRSRKHFLEILEGNAGSPASSPQRFTFFPELVKQVKYYLLVRPARPIFRDDPDLMIAAEWQIGRAFHQIFTHIVGRSLPAARLRAAVWQSIFTHDMRRYYRSLYDRMGDTATLITGPSGTGKELVARAIALSRFIPFNPKTLTFAVEWTQSFHALNLSALPATLIESELFGHRHGAFTGATEDRAGWLELCSEWGTVFLDEIGELEPAIQVKLLRVLESRTFQRLGENKDRHFKGKIIAATNRDLASEIAAGRFREDLYYRLCADQVTTPSLHEQLADSPDELPNFVRYLAARIAPEEAEGLTAEVMAWIEKGLGRDYRWPGNIRELERCVRNVLVRGEYRPIATRTKGARARLAEAVRTGELTAEELLSHYCSLVYADTNRNLKETSRRLELDRRTVKQKIDPKLLEEYLHGRNP